MSYTKIIHPEFVPQNVPLLTCIIQDGNIRNEQTLVKQGNLWWTPDMSMYVYYSPTHYKRD
jgi:hypothetical protein